MVRDLGIENAFMLAGGLGTRLRPLTERIPKVLIEVNKKPLILWNIELLKKYGVKRIVIATSHLGNKIEDYLKGGKKFGVEIEYSHSELMLGTGGALGHAREMLGGTFFMCNGDELKNIALEKVLETHSRNNAVATIALKKVDDVTGFGVTDMDGERIKRFVEKPEPGNEPSHLINSGMYLLSEEIFDFIPAGNASIEYDVFPRVANVGRLFGSEFSGQWFPTDTFERLAKARANWKGLD
jgi:NDP-sugar pyrophosphorylase family protein